jgi:hypothetical protein
MRIVVAEVNPRAHGPVWSQKPPALREEGDKIDGGYVLERRGARGEVH